MKGENVKGYCKQNADRYTYECIFNSPAYTGK